MDMASREARPRFLRLALDQFVSHHQSAVQGGCWCRAASRIQPNTETPGSARRDAPTSFAVGASGGPKTVSRINDVATSSGRGRGSGWAGVEFAVLGVLAGSGTFCALMKLGLWQARTHARWQARRSLAGRRR